MSSLFDSLSVAQHGSQAPLGHGQGSKVIAEFGTLGRGSKSSGGAFCPQARGSGVPEFAKHSHLGLRQIRGLRQVRTDGFACGVTINQPEKTWPTGVLPKKHVQMLLRTFVIRSFWRPRKWVPTDLCRPAQLIQVHIAVRRVPCQSAASQRKTMQVRTRRKPPKKKNWLETDR